MNLSNYGKSLDRRNFKSKIAVCCSSLIWSCQQSIQQIATSSKLPKAQNILFIAVDDLKPLLNNYGHPQMHTPNFDRLAKMGVTFTNAHVQQAVCGPSRASIMTGCYPDCTKVWDLHTDFRQSAPNLMSMPEYLITQGYETTAVGKIYHRGSSAKGHDGKSWSLPHSYPYNYDPVYVPTLFDLVGVSISNQAQGKSLVPLMDNDPKTKMKKDYAQSQFDRNGEKVMGYSIRTDRYRYTEWYEMDYKNGESANPSSIIGRELYDYKKDPNETKNFVEAKPYQKVVADLKSKLGQ